jgi:Polyketide cyclase / dehydrase and lipid transport
MKTWLGLTLLVVTAAPLAARAEEPPPANHLSIIYRDEAVVNADLATVWNLYVDMPRYAEWNPWIVYARGEAVVGQSVPVGVMLNGKVLDMAYHIVAADPMRRFCTKDESFQAFFVPGSRCRYLEALPDGTTRTWQELQVDGVLAWLADLTFGATVRAGMHSEIQALKTKAEAR